MDPLPARSFELTDLAATPDRLGSWRRRGDATRGRRKIGKRVVISLIAIAVVVGLMYFLFQPFANPDIHLVLIRNEPAELGDGPMYATGDAATVERFGGQLHRYDESHPPVRLAGMDSPKDVAALKQKLEQIADKKGSVVILYWTVRGVSVDGVPYLLWPATAKNPEGIRLRVSEVLKQIADHPAKTKLVLLDIRKPANAANWPIADDFPTFLKTAVEETNKKSLWLLASHSDLEHSHLDHAHRRSLFNAWTMQGLRSEADLDGDKSISIGEFHRYVSYGVSRSVAKLTGLRTTQTPLLCWGGGKLPGSYPALAPVMPDAHELNGTTSARTLFPKSLVIAEIERDLKREFDALPVNERYPVPPVIPRKMPVVRAVVKKKSMPKTAKTQAAKKAAGPPLTEPDAPTPKPTAPLPVDIAKQLVNAWLWHDAAVRRLSAASPTAVDTAPPLLRRLQAQLLRIERAYRTVGPFPKKKKEKDDAEPTPVNPVEQRLAASLNELIRLFRALLEGRIEVSATASPLEKQVAEHLRSRNGAGLPANSLALLESSHRFAAPNNGFNATQLAARFGKLLTNGNRAQLREWTNGLTPSQSQLAELSLARRLSQSSPARWPAIQAALRTRRFAEKIVALSTGRMRWVRRLLDAADRHRIAGERRLLDGIGSDYENWSLRRFGEAVELYAQALDRLKLVDSAVALRNDLRYELSDRAAWARRIDDVSADGVDRLQQLTNAADALRSLSTILDGSTAANMQQLRRAHSRMQTIQRELDADFRRTIIAPATSILAGEAPVPGDIGRIDAALQLGHLSAERRLTLHRALQLAAGKTDFTAMTVPESPMIPPDRTMTSTDAARIRARAALKVAMLRQRGDVEGISNEALAGTGNLTWKQCREFEQSNRNAQQRTGSALRTTIGGIVASDRPSGVWNNYRITLRKSADAIRGSNTIDTFENETRFDRILRRNHIADGVELVRWQRQRMLAAANDAPLAQATALRKTAADYRAVLVRHLPKPPDPVASADVEAEAPAVVSLRESPIGRLNLALRSQQNAACPVMVWVEYDDTLLRLRSLDDANLPKVKHGEAPDSLTVDNAARPTITLNPGQAATVSVELTRLVPSRIHPAKVVFHVVCGKQILRRTVVVGLPSPRAVELIAAGPENVQRLVSHDSAGPRLYPFPNRTTGFRFVAKNLTGKARTVNVRLIALQQRLAVELPESEVAADRAAALLRRIQTGQTLASSGDVNLPASDTAVAVPLKAPPGPNSKANPDAPPISINAGLVSVIEDKATKKVSLRSIAIAPQRPRRFLDIRVSYDAERGTVAVRVKAKDRRWLPEEAVAVRGGFAGSTQPQPGLSGVLKRDSEELVLTGTVRNKTATAVLQLAVDGFPRAFVYRFRGDRSLAAVPEWLSRRSLRITAPKSEAVFGKSNKSIPVTFQVDAPVGSFQDGRDTVEIGIDIDRDRVLKNEPAIRFASDRQSLVTIEKIADDGGIEIKTVVGDYIVNLPTRGVPSRRVDLLGRIEVGGESAWSNSLPVVFDTNAPGLAPVRNVRIVQGSAAVFDVQADDSKLSGVKRIELFVDEQRTGKFPKEGGIVAAEPTGKGNWAATLKTEEMKPGSYPVLVRAVDTAGNASEMRTTRLIILSKAAAKQAAAGKPNRVEGVLIFDKEPVAGATITLEPVAGNGKKQPAAAPPAKIDPVTTNGQGQFSFPKVPPGEYQLTAFKRNLSNKNRRRSVKIQVASPPQPAVSVRVMLR